MNTRGLAFGWIVISTALAVACGSDSDSDSGKKNTGGSGGSTGGSGGGNTGGSNTGGSNTGGSNTGGSNTGGSAGSSTGGTAGSSSGGTAGSATGGNAGSSTGGAAGGSGGTKPDGGLKSCAELASEYATALEAAKACNPVLSVLQCTKQVGDELPCPCPTFVNPANAKAAAELDDLQAAWNAQNCGSGVICPAVLCQAPTGGVCQANGSLAGKCANSVPN